mmetsp:Transcript_58570/g.163366  ORF Transcript_58570/g.163366 Transcript_58570/m.163366 type:complete len:232 (-) Transcript_58570:1160-1855(-)
MSQDRGWGSVSGPPAPQRQVQASLLLRACSGGATCAAAGRRGLAHRRPSPDRRSRARSRRLGSSPRGREGRGPRDAAPSPQQAALSSFDVRSERTRALRRGPRRIAPSSRLPYPNKFRVTLTGCALNTSASDRAPSSPRVRPPCLRSGRRSSCHAAAASTCSNLLPARSGASLATPSRKGIPRACACCLTPPAGPVPGSRSLWHFLLCGARSNPASIRRLRSLATLWLYRC